MAFWENLPDLKPQHLLGSLPSHSPNGFVCHEVNVLGNNNKKNYIKKWAIYISIWTFVLAIGFSIITQIILGQVESIIVNVAVLFLVIMIGIVFDLIGISATSAVESNLNARAANKVYGAKKAVKLVKNRDQVASFCADVIGDIAGIATGSITAILVMRMIVLQEFAGTTTLNIILTALVSSLTVGGKALGKYIAVTFGTEVIFYVGKILTRIDDFLSLVPNKAPFRSRK
ncbi:hypothetical protein [Natranaerofaba carboxydovora]|uniref:hypothetical protein n=1 Tax=Natranaerofaba carboxydovora TaxID=2742683 RepID=UPI001F134FD9|nr:hypothetical protein [Natranaerofaba carboxydovora]